MAFCDRVGATDAGEGFKCERLDPRQLAELVPLVGDNALGGLFTHYGGHANPQRTTQAYAWALQDHGGRILQHTAVTGITVKAGKAVEVVTDRGRFGCDFLVIAAGPQTGPLAAMVGAERPLAPARGERVRTEAAPLLAHGRVR